MNRKLTLSLSDIDPRRVWVLFGEMGNFCCVSILVCACVTNDIWSGGSLCPLTAGAPAQHAPRLCEAALGSRSLLGLHQFNNAHSADGN